MKAQRVGLPDSGGVEIEYEWHGPREGRAFVLLHGFTGSRDDWFEHLPALGAHRPTLAIDQRGHGGSTNLGDPDAYTLEALVGDLAATLTQLGIESVDLLGHSMGGAVALRFALAHPERVRSLVLMDTMDTALPIGTAEVFEKLADFVRGPGAAKLCEVMRRRAADDPLRPASMRRCEERMGSERFWKRIEAKHAAMDPEALVGLGRQLLRADSVRPRLGEITCPTLVIVGEQDVPFREPSDAMAKAIPDARLVVVPDAAHSPQLENPEAWLAAIEAHLDRAGAAPQL